MGRAPLALPLRTRSAHVGPVDDDGDCRLGPRRRGLPLDARNQKSGIGGRNGDNADLMDGRDLEVRLMQIPDRAPPDGSTFNECDFIRPRDYYNSTGAVSCSRRVVTTHTRRSRSRVTGSHAYRTSRS